MWTFRLAECLNALSHTCHLYGFSPVWSLMWTARYPEWVNALSHTWHLYALSPLWILLCSTRLPDCVNRLLQTLHSNGFSPVWVRMCLFRWVDRLNALSHTWHLYGFSPVWTLMWSFRYPERTNSLSHTWHLYGLSPLWILLCLTRSPDCVNRLLQTLHSNGFSPVWVRLCIVNARLLWQHLPHSMHLYLLLWTFIWYSLLCITRLQDCVKRLLQTLHSNGFSPLWILLCITRLQDCVNRLLQTLHSNGFSPEWLRLCTVNAWLLWQHFPHSMHLNLLLWTFICCFKVVCDVKRFSHWVHVHRSPPLCDVRWACKQSFLVNRFSQTVHTYGLGLSSRGCSVTSLLSASMFISKGWDLSTSSASLSSALEFPAYVQHNKHTFDTQSGCRGDYVFFCLTIMLETFCEVSSSRNELQRPLKVTINDIVDRYILQLCHNAGRHKLSLQMVTGKYDNIIRCCALLIRQKKPLYRRQLETTSTFR